MQRFLSKQLLGSALIASLALALLASGCGGGESDSSGSTHASRPAEATGAEETIQPETSTAESAPTEKPSGPLTKAEFVKRANEICAKRYDEGLELLRSYMEQNIAKGEAEAAVEARGIYTHFVPAIEAEVGELEALGAPSGDAQKVKAITVAFRRGIRASIEQEYNASNVDSFGKDFNQLVKLARAYGLADCVL